MSKVTIERVHIDIDFNDVNNATIHATGKMDVSEFKEGMTLDTVVKMPLADPEVIEAVVNTLKKVAMAIVEKHDIEIVEEK